MGKEWPKDVDCNTDKDKYDDDSLIEQINKLMALLNNFH